MFFDFGKGQSRSQGLTAFLILAWSRRKEPLPATIVIIDSDKAPVNKRNEEALQNAFILIYHCEIYPYYVYILFKLFLTQKKKKFFKGPIKCFESVHLELGRSGDGRRTIF